MTSTPASPPRAQQPRGRPGAARAVRTEVAKAVVGQDAAVSGLLVALLCGGHVLMEGVPGRRQDAAGAHPRRRRSTSRPGACSSRPT